MAITALGIGSGLDLNGLLDQLESAERQKLVPISEQHQSYQSKISAFGKLEAALASVQTAAKALNSSDLFNTHKSSVSGDALQAAAGSDAVAGSYDIEVTQLARAYSIATAGIADKSADLGAADIHIDLANGDALDVSVAADGSSLENIRDAINEQQAGVQASIVNDGGASPYRLVLASADTGTEAAISNVDFGALAGSLSLDAGTEVTARNAELTVNGIDISSQSNLVEEAIQGVSLTLEDVGSATVTVERDADAIKQAIEGFVTAYNNFESTVSGLSSYNAETGDAGILLGNSALRNVESRMRSALSDPLDEGALRHFSDIGISVQLDGSLQLDEDRLAELIDNDPAGLQAALAGEDEAGGLAGGLYSNLEQVLEEDGLLNNITEGLETSVEQMNERYLNMETRIENTVSRYRTQFSQLDSTIARMNSTSDYLSQQFDMMNAQLGYNKQ